MVRRRPVLDSEPSPERWIVSYADFITLLFAFFTMLYAIALEDAGKGRRVVESIRQSFSEARIFEDENSAVLADPRRAPITLAKPEAFNKRKEERQLDVLGKRVREMGQGDGQKSGMRVRRTEEGLVISLASQLHFEVGGQDLQSESKKALAELAALLQQVPNHVRVEGHTDNVPLRSRRFATNWDLSSARAVRIVRELQAAGLPAHRLSAAGHAEFRPLVSNATAAGRSINRRVDVVILRARLAPSDG